MSISAFLIRAWACLALTATASSAWALPLTLNTTALDANSKLSLSTEAAELLTLTGITVSPGGKATSAGAGAYNVPITSLTVDVKLLPPTLAPQKALAAGSSLTLTNTLKGGSVSFGNLALDFNALSIAGDITTAAGSQTQVPLFTFKVTQPLTFSLKGGISLTESLGSLYLTESASQTFAQGLGVPSALAYLFTQVDFGTIDARIVPWFRPKATEVLTSSVSRSLSAASLAVSPVPEPAVGGLWALGGIALAWARRSVRG
jgi:hypothetical protein